MQTVEMYFNDTIARYSLFKQSAITLIQQVPSLTAFELQNRCEELSILHREITKDKEQLFIRMEFMGRGILDASYIGEFQRALERSILVCNSLYAEITTYKNSLIVLHS